MTNSEDRIVEAWNEVLNAGDVERLVAMSCPDIRPARLGLGCEDSLRIGGT